MPRRTSAVALPIAFACLVAAACGSGSAGRSSGGTGSDGGSSGGCSSCPPGFSCTGGSAVCKSAVGVPAFGNVYLIVEENHGYSTVAGATYIASLIAANASASNYQDTLVHPSLPNYLGLSAGSTQGITCDCQAGGGGSACPGSCNILEAPACTCVQASGAKNVADEIEAAGLTWHAYGEDMTAPGCDLANHGSYVARHVPFLYFESIQASAARCANVVPFTSTTFPGDLGKYSYSFIAPNLCDDGHDSCAPLNDEVKQTDTWLSTTVPAIIDSPSFKKNGVLFITWDEGDESLFSTTDQVLLLVISPFAKQTVTATAYNHYSLLGTIEEGLGLLAPHLGTAPIIDVWK